MDLSACVGVHIHWISPLLGKSSGSFEHFTLYFYCWIFTVPYCCYIITFRPFLKIMNLWVADQFSNNTLITGQRNDSVFKGKQPDERQDIWKKKLMVYFVSVSQNRNSYSSHERISGKNCKHILKTLQTFIIFKFGLTLTLLIDVL